MKQCPNCQLYWDNDLTRCPQCSETLPSNEASSEDADEGVFERVIPDNNAPTTKKWDVSDFYYEIGELEKRADHILLIDTHNRTIKAFINYGLGDLCSMHVIKFGSHDYYKAYRNILTELDRLWNIESLEGRRKFKTGDLVQFIPPFEHPLHVAGNLQESTYHYVLKVIECPREGFSDILETPIWVPFDTVYVLETNTGNDVPYPERALQIYDPNRDEITVGKDEDSSCRSEHINPS